MTQAYRVSGLAVIDRDGAVVYGLSRDENEAGDICSILNDGIATTWDAVERELKARNLGQEVL